MIDKPLEKLIEQKELAERLHVSLGTLRTWRTEGKGPPFHRIGLMIRFAFPLQPIWNSAFQHEII